MMEPCPKGGFKMKTFFFVSLFISIFASLPAMATEQHHLLSISQGISSPALTNSVNYSHGFTHQNPTGVIYQTTARLTGQYDSGDTDSGSDNNGYGGELGVGNGKYGIAGGYYTRDCDNCEGDGAGSVGATFSGVGLG